MDGWVAGRVGGWMEGLKEGWAGRRIDGWIKSLTQQMKRMERRTNK